MAVLEMLSLACRLFVGGLFLYASYDKVWAPAVFAASVGQYEILPLWAVNGASALLAWLELFTGVMLIAGVWVRAAALWASGLLVMFTGLMIYAGLTGAGYNCGCFPGEGNHTAGFTGALRDLGFLLPALYLLKRPGRWLRLTKPVRPGGG